MNNAIAVTISLASLILAILGVQTARYLRAHPDPKLEELWIYALGWPLILAAASIAGAWILHSQIP